MRLSGVSTYARKRGVGIKQMGGAARLVTRWL